MLRMTSLEIKNIKDQVQRILHVPGNYMGGNLEFAIVLDYHVDKESLMEFSSELVKLLKSTDKIFINARLNLIKWINDEKIIKEVSSMGMLQMGRCFEDYEKGTSNKTYDLLTEQLKKFYARSKLIILVTDNAFFINDMQTVNENLNPFLHRKLMKIDIPTISEI